MNACQCPTETASATERPQFRTREDESGASVQVALPGVRKEDLKLTLHQASLKIEATRRRHDDAVTRYGLEIRLTSRLDGTKATAALDAGVLTLQVPVREEAKPRQIAVN